MKIDNINENSNRFRRMKRALFGDDTGKIKTFAILTPENPNAIQASSEENDKATKEFKRALRILGLTYTPLRGSYGNKENSYIVFNCALSDAKNLAGIYQQQSFFWGKTSSEGSVIGYYETTNGGLTYNLIDMSDTITLEDEATDYFSKFGIKFRINMREFGDDVPEVESDPDFEESLNESRTPMSRAAYRRKAYRK